MKKMIAFFTSLMMSLSMFCLSVAAEEAVEENVEQTVEQGNKLFEGIFESFGVIILAAVLGLGLILSIIFLAVSHSKSRTKHEAKKEKKQKEAEIRAMIEAKLAGKDDEEEDEDADAEGYYDEYGYWHWNNPYYRDLERGAINVPTRELKAVPELESKPSCGVKPVVVRDLITVPHDCPKCKTVKIEDEKKEDSKGGIMKTVLATVAITALGCHLLQKIRK